MLSNGEAGSRMYVEVNPEEEFPEATRKVRRSGVGSPVLFASTDGPFGFDASTSKYFLGPVLYKDKQSRASVTICQERDSHFCNPGMRKSHHGCGKFERSKHIRENYDKLGRYWSEAHNRTMWPARARRPTRVQTLQPLLDPEFVPCCARNFSSDSRSANGFNVFATTTSHTHP